MSFEDGSQHLPRNQNLSGRTVPSTENQAGSSQRHQGYGRQARTLGVPHAALWDEICRPGSRRLRGTTVDLPRHKRRRPEAEGQQALERVGMAHRLRHYPSQLSGGQQQRVAVARALVGDPLILMADEPTGNLDSKNGEAVMELLRDLHRYGATICMVTHDQRYANFAERTIHLFDGRIAEEPYEAIVSA